MGPYERVGDYYCQLEQVHVADDYDHCLTSYVMIALALSGRSSMNLWWIELTTTYKMVMSPFNIGSILVKKKSTLWLAWEEALGEPNKLGGKQ
jgi:hypothetical protein